MGANPHTVLHRGQRDATGAARPIGGRGQGGFWGAHSLSGGRDSPAGWQGCAGGKETVAVVAR